MSAPDQPAIEQALGLLSDRVLWKWKVAHLLLDRAGRYTCLDLNVTAPNVDVMKDRIMDLATAMKPEDPLPTAEEGLWQRFAQAEFVRKTDTLFGLHERGLTRARGLMILVRQE